MKDEAIDESLTMDIVNDNVAYAILDMLVQKNLKLGTGMLELDYGLYGFYHLVIKGGSMLYEKHGLDCFFQWFSMMQLRQAHTHVH